MTPPLTFFVAPVFGARSFTFDVVDFAGFAITFDSDCTARRRHP